MTRFLILALAAAAGCPAVVPAPKIHATKTANGFTIDAACPKGWLVHVDKKYTDAYNASPKGYVEMINMVAETYCVPDRSASIVKK
jgi:hypothetical protein